MLNYVHAYRDNVYFVRDSEVGSLISRNRLAVVQIRLRLPLDAGLWGGKRNLVDIGRTAGPPELEY